MREGIEQFIPVAIPHLSVFSPYAPDHIKYPYKFNSLLGQLEDAVDLQKFILNHFGKPIPSGSNRGLFSPRCGVVNQKLTF